MNCYVAGKLYFVRTMANVDSTSKTLIKTKQCLLNTHLRSMLAHSQRAKEPFISRLST